MMVKINAPVVTTHIPKTLAPCFQEYNFEQLEPAQHADLIIGRVLAYGNRSEVGWLWRTYGWERVRAWVQRDGARRLPWRRYTLWCVLLDLPRAPHPRPREQRIWPY